MKRQILLHTGYYTQHDLDSVKKEAVPGRELSLLSGTDDPTGKTLDCATFDLGELRMIDTPGHTILIPMVIDAAQNADLVVYVVSVAENEFQKGLKTAREHLALFRGVGLNNLIVILNKIDTVPAEAVNQAEQDFLKLLGSQFTVSFFRMSAVNNPQIQELMEKISTLELTPRKIGPIMSEITITGQSGIMLILGKSLILYTGKSQVIGELIDLGESTFVRPKVVATSKWKLKEPIEVGETVVGRDPSTGNSVLIGKIVGF